MNGEKAIVFTKWEAFYRKIREGLMISCKHNKSRKSSRKIVKKVIILKPVLQIVTERGWISYNNNYEALIII